MPEIDFNVILTWPQATVALFLIFAFMIWPGVMAHLGRKETQEIKRTLTENNGGGSVKDALDRIEDKMERAHHRIIILERVAEKHHGIEF